MAIKRKLVAFDEETWAALDLYARESMRDFQELADEAFHDLLVKHGRPTDLRAALRESAGVKSKATTKTKTPRKLRR